MTSSSMTPEQITDDRLVELAVQIKRLLIDKCVGMRTFEDGRRVVIVDLDAIPEQLAALLSQHEVQS